jgi:hypothetical protein
MEKKSAKNCTLYHVVKKLYGLILVLPAQVAPICKDTQTFYNFKNFADFLNVCSANILVLTGLQHQYGAKIQAFDIFQTPLSSHYPLPLNANCIAKNRIPFGFSNMGGKSKHLT